MRLHHENAAAIVDFLTKHPKVKRVLYPGLKTSPNYRLATTQMTGFGAMVSFELVSGADVKAFIESLEVITLAESLGGIESLIEVPSIMTHGSIPRKIRLANGISDELIRLSVGIEAKEDLLADLKQALAHS